ncbi:MULTISPECIES: hypothetical protein [unclassified Kitasatospora]|nr:MULTISPECIES: hypothetical protein [unclassified Kitasatospora]
MTADDPIAYITLDGGLIAVETPASGVPGIDNAEFLTFTATDLDLYPTGV